MKINVPREEAEAFSGRVKERRMGELFANFEAYDVQETRRIAREEGIKEGIEKLICTLKELHVDDETIKLQLMKRYDLSRKDADKMIEEYM